MGILSHIKHFHIEMERIDLNYSSQYPCIGFPRVRSVKLRIIETVYLHDWSNENQLPTSNLLIMF